MVIFFSLFSARAVPREVFSFGRFQSSLFMYPYVAPDVKSTYAYNL